MAIVAAIMLVGVLKLAIDGLLALVAREYATSWPELQKQWLGKGSWVSFSRRFGLPYAAAMILGAFAWVVAAARLVPNTSGGVWLLFGPSFTMLAIGVVLAALYLARWIGRS